MTRSIFDPTGGEAEHSGSSFTGPRADDDSNLPAFIKEPHKQPDGAIENATGPASVEVNAAEQSQH